MNADAGNINEGGTSVIWNDLPLKIQARDLEQHRCNYLCETLQPLFSGRLSTPPLRRGPRGHVVCHMLWSFSVFFSVDVQLKRRYETRLILFRPKKSERRPVAKESQRQKRLTSPALALNQNQNSVPGHARRGGCPVLGEGMWPGACCRAAETSDWKVKGIVSDSFASICTWRCFCFFVHICLRRYSIFRIGCVFFCVCVCFFFSNYILLWHNFTSEINRLSSHFLRAPTATLCPCCLSVLGLTKWIWGVGNREQGNKGGLS